MMQRVLKLSNLTPSSEKAWPEHVTRWNINRYGGWKLYEEITDRSMDKVREAVDDDNMNIDEVINKFDKMHEKN